VGGRATAGGQQCAAVTALNACGCIAGVVICRAACVQLSTAASPRDWLCRVWWFPLGFFAVQGRVRQWFARLSICTWDMGARDHNCAKISWSHHLHMHLHGAYAAGIVFCQAMMLTCVMFACGAAHSNIRIVMQLLAPLQRHSDVKMVTTLEMFTGRPR
jgi:hypothetical protein